MVRDEVGAVGADECAGQARGTGLLAQSEGDWAEDICGQKKRNEMTAAITMVEMTDRDIDLAERAAKRLGFAQTAYTSTSGWAIDNLPPGVTADDIEGCQASCVACGRSFARCDEDQELCPRCERAEDERDE
mgnify:CR=1 FL=1